jgi:stage V sporulation protein G
VGKDFLDTEEVEMELTDVRVSPVNEEKLKAFVNITIDDCFIVRDLKVINGKNGLFVSMPSRRRKDGTFRDIAHPLNNETREMMEQRILSEYEKTLSEVVETTISEDVEVASVDDESEEVATDSEELEEE